MINNIKDYLEDYRSINDYVEMKPGRIVNLSFEVSLFIDKNYNKADVITMVINKIRDYMDINKHEMGEDIFVGDLEHEISDVDGVINLISLKVFNELGPDYSSDVAGQTVKSVDQCSDNQDDASMRSGNRTELDLDASEGLLIGYGDSMFEIKHPETDIIVRVKEH